MILGLTRLFKAAEAGRFLDVEDWKTVSLINRDFHARAAIPLGVLTSPDLRRCFEQLQGLDLRTFLCSYGIVCKTTPGKEGLLDCILSTHLACKSS
jgi:hypothetical protein